MRRFLIVHGFTGSGPDHWQTWLVARLRKGGASVSFPELPNKDNPRPTEWDATLERELVSLADGDDHGEGERVVVCHSLGAILWLRYAAAVGEHDRPERVLLVAPPSGPSVHPEIAGFFPVEVGPESVAAAAGSTLLVCSDNDPYCPEGAEGFYGEPLRIRTEVIPGAAHLNSDAGYGAWPHVEAWCLGRRPGVAW